MKNQLLIQNKLQVLSSAIKTKLTDHLPLTTTALTSPHQSQYCAWLLTLLATTASLFDEDKEASS